jgi:transcriptional regulator with GAF, ATPase, and Fis domain
VVLTAGGADRYSDEHARLLELLADPFSIALANTLVHREVLQLRDRLADDNLYLNRELLRISGDEIVGADFGLREVMHQVRHVAPTESPVLLTGETGVGKDVIANAIHLGSPRRAGPFIPVNCGAIPDSLIDSELFGHEKGAFTGALAQKRGRFERATGGTIMLDEVGEMPLEAQVRLLRVLQHREIERVGGAERIPVDIRIIAATNQDLAALVHSGRFREDLYFRLHVFPIVVPPLRDRRSDLPALVHHFIERKAKELKIAETPRLAVGAIDDAESDDETLDLDAIVASHIRRVLRRTGGKIHGRGGAGELLGVNPNTLRYKMRKLGIPFRKRRLSE